jgi:hypothetical protein
VPQDIEDAIIALAIEQPAFGQVRIANLRDSAYASANGFIVSPARPIAASASSACCTRRATRKRPRICSGT